MEEIKETAWNLCKKYDGSLKRRCNTLLTNFVSIELENIFSIETENLYREDWIAEVNIFCSKYGYA